MKIKTTYWQIGLAIAKLSKIWYTYTSSQLTVHQLDWSTQMLRFPQREDVRLQRAPLAEVICQVRFPPVLRIASEQPFAFQERVRERFPQLEVEQGVVVRMEPLGTSLPSAKPEPRIFRFKSPDGHTAVSLALNFYALSTTSYTHWRDFLELLQLVNQAACEVYNLPYALRLGLRYINHLTLENTGVSSVAELRELLRPELTMLLRGNCWDEPLEMLNQLLLVGENNERLTLRSGFRGEEEPVFLLDFDYYAEGNITLENLPDLCQRYHDVIYYAFRWCIPDEKLVVFDPVPVSEGE
ncbi:MAG: TIGR04255 family protein [Anaerolineae bacterium]|nr:TIGR04255 family protein [Anaerolineae bacterium]